ncbi:hypothetical protein GCM10010919_30770 [Alishewanella longhuensis]|uniref:DUF4124 domain-containing protein n=1 Tax=Alishewanella longhuensis TaxID=1091037 RepID=A0ABQ3L1H1_9ALTE|nr:DUF4124 domain-containing protein [Alishewanella longhuensis]GHG76144.1 hypothetical protein GCM10010919_30770 [Alishewanella longhuensis]
MRSFWLLLILLVLFLMPAPATAQEKKIYVSRDANGVLIFSDTPAPGAEEVSFTVRPNLMEATEVRFPEKKAAPPEAYQVEIMQPENQGTVRDNTGSVYISGRITPRFQRGFRVRLLLNGLPQGEPQNSATFVLRDIDRGEHNIQLELLDQNGKLIATSPITTFYLHRASLIRPN